MIKKSFCAILAALMLAVLPPKPANSFVLFTIDLSSLKEQIDGIINAVKEAIMNCKAVKAIADTMAAIGSAMDTIEKFKQDVMDQLAELNKIKELAEEYYGEYKEYRAYVEQQIKEAEETIKRIEEAKNTIVQMKEEYIDPLAEMAKGEEEEGEEGEEGNEGEGDEASAGEGEYSSADKVYADKNAAKEGADSAAGGGKATAAAGEELSDQEKEDEEEVTPEGQEKELRKMNDAVKDIQEGKAGKFRMSAKNADLKGALSAVKDKVKADDAVKSKAAALSAAAVKDKPAAKDKAALSKASAKEKAPKAAATMDKAAAVKADGMAAKAKEAAPAAKAKEAAPAAKSDAKKGFLSKNKLNMSSNEAPSFFFEMKYSHSFADMQPKFGSIATGRTAWGNDFISKGIAQTCELNADDVEDPKNKKVDECVGKLQLQKKTNDEQALEVTQEELMMMKRENSTITLVDYMRAAANTNVSARKSLDDITDKISSVGASRDLDMLLVDIEVEMAKVLNAYSRMLSSSLINNIFQDVDKIAVED